MRALTGPAGHDRRVDDLLAGRCVLRVLHEVASEQSTCGAFGIRPLLTCTERAGAQTVPAAVSAPHSPVSRLTRRAYRVLVSGSEDEVRRTRATPRWGAAEMIGGQAARRRRINPLQPGLLRAPLQGPCAGASTLPG